MELNYNTKKLHTMLCLHISYFSVFIMKKKTDKI